MQVLISGTWNDIKHQRVWPTSAILTATRPFGPSSNKATELLAAPADCKASCAKRDESTRKNGILLMVQKSGKLTSWGNGRWNPIIYRGFIHFQGGWEWDFWTINSMMEWFECGSHHIPKWKTKRPNQEPQMHLQISSRSPGSLMFSQVVAKSPENGNLLTNNKKKKGKRVTNQHFPYMFHFKLVKTNWWKPTFSNFWKETSHGFFMLPKIISSTPWHTGAKFWDTESWSALSKAKTRLKQTSGKKGTGPRKKMMDNLQPGCRFFFGDLFGDQNFLAKMSLNVWSCLICYEIWEVFSWWKKSWLRKAIPACQAPPLPMHMQLEWTHHSQRQTLRWLALLRHKINASFTCS